VKFGNYELLAEVFTQYNNAHLLNQNNFNWFVEDKFRTHATRNVLALFQPSDSSSVEKNTEAADAINKIHNLPKGNTSLLTVGAMLDIGKFTPDKLQVGRRIMLELMSYESLQSSTQFFKRKKPRHESKSTRSKTFRLRHQR